MCPVDVYDIYFSEMPEQSVRFCGKGVPAFEEIFKILTITIGSNAPPLGRLSRRTVARRDLRRGLSRFCPTEGEFLFQYDLIRCTS
jgi:hypothetical protein